MVLVLGGLLPCIAVSLIADQYELPFPLAYYTLIWSENPFGLIFGLLVALPYGPALVSMVANRQLFYARTRLPSRAIIRALLLRSVVVTGLTFFALAILVGLWVAALPVTYGSTVISTPHEAREMEASWVMFSEVTRYGGWGLFVLVYAVWLALNAGVYAHVTTAAVLLVRRRWALVLPWLGWFAVGMVVAYVDPAYSPFAVMPFNLQPTAPWKPFVGLLGALGVAAAMHRVLLSRADDLACMQ